LAEKIITAKLKANDRLCRRQLKKKTRKLKISKKLRIPKRYHEEALTKQGFTNIAGLDEVGRGALAGPLIAAAVILSVKKIYKIRDSKLLNSKLRNLLAAKIKKEARCYAIGKASVSEIKKLGLQPATYLAFKRAVSKLKAKPDFLLIDAYTLPESKILQKGIKKGDLICTSISAASIVAKDYRDKLMIKLHKKYPHYRFDLHKGYGTALHLERLKQYGPSKIHRQNFAPVKNLTF